MLLGCLPSKTFNFCPSGDHKTIVLSAEAVTIWVFCNCRTDQTAAECPVNVVTEDSVFFRFQYFAEQSHEPLRNVFVPIPFDNEHT